MGSLLLQTLACLCVILHFNPSIASTTPAFTYQKLVIAPSPQHQNAESSSRSENKHEAGTWAVEVFHRDSLPVLEQTQAQSDEAAASSRGSASALEERLRRDAARVEAINRRAELAAMEAKTVDLKPSSEQSTSLIAEEDIASPIVSGASLGSGEYFTRFGIGTPPKQAYFVLDTGSDISWTQCAPCNRCYKQTDPLFNPAASSSFRYVNCGSPLCGQLQITACRRSQCLYQVSYGDGSFTVGNFAQETLSFGGATFRNIGVGCGHDNEGLFVGAAGLLGLGSGPLSFPTQIKSDFSYCLADRFSGKSSQLVVGRGAAPAGSRFTPLVKNVKLGSFYFVALQGISVGGRALAVSPSTFGAGGGGVILDSGTSVTRLAAAAYAALRDTFRAGTSGLKPAGSFSLFDTCYDLSGMQAVDVPTVDLLFAGGTSLHLPPSNYLVPVDSSGTYCLAFAPTSSSLSIIGNMQQQGFRVSFSSLSSRVGFAPNQC